MKGVIFNILEDMIVEHAGMVVWNELLDKHAPAGRTYVSAKSYSEDELFAIVTEVATMLSMPLQTLVKSFGTFLFSGLASRHQDVMQRFPDFSALVMGIHDVIHVEVNKLYHEPALPTILCQKHADGNISLQYTSPRKLCFCAEGLLFGAAEHFKQPISINHHTCMHQGADHCVLDIRLTDD